MSTQGSSFPGTSGSLSQEATEGCASLISSRKLNVTLLSSEWGSSKGGLSTINRELAIQLAKNDNVEVSMYLPQCSEADERAATGFSVCLLKAKNKPGYDPIDWLASIPRDHRMDVVIGHGIHLGRQVPMIKDLHPACKWIQVVHTDPEELGMFKDYAGPIVKGEKKHQAEVELCKLADQVVAVGPKLTEAFACYLRPCGRDQHVINLTPGIFSEFSNINQAAEEGGTFRVLVFGRGDSEDFRLKGYDIAARAVAKLKDKGSFKLVFVGAPNGEEEKVKERFLKEGISPSQLIVRRSKEREELAEQFCEADLVIMPSRTEGFGLAALEALSAGLPVLVSSNSGIGKALEKVPYGSNFVVNSEFNDEDPVKWAEAIKAVCGKERKVRLKEAIFLRQNYAETYQWEGQCSALVEKMLKMTKGVDHGTSDPGTSLLTSCRLSSALGSESRIKENHGKRPLHPLETATPKRQRQNTDFPETDIDISKVVESLQREYNRRAEFSPLQWSKGMKLQLKEVYTKLRVVSRSKAGSSEIDVDDIFGSSEEDNGQLVLVEGSPGIGKTTLCLKLAHDWANGAMPRNFPSFKLVFLLKCRDMKGDIVEEIFEQLLHEDLKENTKGGLVNTLENLDDQNQILIILDGLDELPEQSGNRLNKVLGRKKLSSCYVLTTTRQEKGIYTREQFQFDICLVIEGFSEENSLEFIRKHFRNIGPEDSSKGERLIKVVKRNPLLRKLQNNPLNLLLLCVIYQDEKRLPSSSTNLYQTIVRCLLKRYCAKENLKASKKDKDLDKQFEITILALGKLAWECLLNDRLSFYEDELEELERRNENIVARRLGLVYKEESYRLVNPRHAYSFLHKTFQEYFAASYIAHKLRGREFHTLEQVLFPDHAAKKFRQVFLFVCGILREEAHILFEHMGNMLQKQWDWLKCENTTASFFIKSWKETGKAERMAKSLCSFLPFPRVLRVHKSSRHRPVLRVLKACAGFSEVQTPAEVHFLCGFDFAVKDIQLVTELPNVTSVTSMF